MYSTVCCTDEVNDVPHDQLSQELSRHRHPDFRLEKLGIKQIICTTCMYNHDQLIMYAQGQPELSE
jgi:hypothetical protein